MKRLIQLALPLFVVYLVLTNNIDEPSNWVLGAFLALGLALLMPSGELPPVSLRRLPGIAWGFVSYAWLVAVDVISGAISTAKIVLARDMPLDEGILAVPSGTKTELGTALSAHAITLSPGELVVATDEAGTMYVHCLNVSESEKTIKQAQDERRKSIRLMVE